MKQPIMPPGVSTSPLIWLPSEIGAAGIVGMGMHTKRPASRRPFSGTNPSDLCQRGTAAQPSLTTVTAEHMFGT